MYLRLKTPALLLGTSLLGLCLILFSCRTIQKSTVTDAIQVSKIWDTASHSAFTELIRFKGAFYCSFREGSGHMPGTDGKARIIRSVDGEKWESVALLEMEGIDIRDPKISVTPDGRIMVMIGGSVYDQKVRSKLLSMYPLVSFSDASGKNFSAPEKAVIDPEVLTGRNWIWRVTWHKGVGYGIDYGSRTPYLMKTSDGKYFEKVSKLDVDGYPNESAVRFDKNDRIHVLIRREEGDKMGVFAQSAPPYTHWSYNKIQMRLGGPNFIFYNNHIIIGSRLYEPSGAETAIRIADLNGNFLKTIKLPSKGDTSYPGMVVHNGKLWFSYYSSHEGKTSIYLAKIPLKELQP